MKLYLKKLLHILGISSIISATGLMAYMFYSIITVGSFIGYEHNLMILYPEFGLSIFSFGYASYIYIQRFKSLNGEQLR